MEENSLVMVTLTQIKAKTNTRKKLLKDNVGKTSYFLCKAVEKLFQSCLFSLISC